VLLSWLKVLNDNKIQTVGDLLIVGNVGEEELGNLRGMKAYFRGSPRHRRHGRPRAGSRWHVLMLGTASHRYEVTFKGPGGHSFGAFGEVPSAIHGMGRAIARIADIQTRQGSQDHVHGRHRGRRHLGQHHRARCAHGGGHPLRRHGAAARHRKEDPGGDRPGRGRGEQALGRDHAQRIDQADRRPAGRPHAGRIR
jgi:hypothetical protein